MIQKGALKPPKEANAMRVLISRATAGTLRIAPIALLAPLASASRRAARRAAGLLMP
jgi:hypothetical protein